MRLTIQHPGGLLCRQAGGKLPKQQQEPMLIVSHITCLSAAQPA